MNVYKDAIHREISILKGLIETDRVRYNDAAAVASSKKYNALMELGMKTMMEEASLRMQRNMVKLEALQEVLEAVKERVYGKPGEDY